MQQNTFGTHPNDLAALFPYIAGPEAILAKALQNVKK